MTDKEIFDDIWAPTVCEVQLNIPMIGKSPSAIMIQIEKEIKEKSNE